MTGLRTIVDLAVRSLWNRRGTALLTIFSIGISVTLLLGVERVRTEARLSFANTISGTDLIVGARSGDLNLLLYSVFRIGNATNNITWQTFKDLAQRREVAWTIPLSLGDSHRGFRVLGTSPDYYQHYRFAGDRSSRQASRSGTCSTRSSVPTSPLSWAIKPASRWSSPTASAR